MMKRILLILTGIAAMVSLAGGAAACGGGSPTGPSNGGGGGGGGGGGTATNTITITSAGVNPANITISPGTRVTFVNNNNVPHEMASDPHPDHGDCPEINQVGFLTPGQQRQTGNLNTVRTCGFHDHNRENDRTLQGTIRIQ